MNAARIAGAAIGCDSGKIDRVERVKTPGEPMRLVGRSHTTMGWPTDILIFRGMYGRRLA